MNISKIDYTSLIKKYAPLVSETADRLWDFSEPAFSEYRSSQLLKDILAEQGFQIEASSPLLPTAFAARYGNGHPVIGFLGEYDALPGLSQQAGLSSPSPVSSDDPQAPGHGCGHNLLGAGLLACVLFLKDLLKEEGLPGTILFFGCPAEENFSGKSRMIEQGFFEGVDAAFSWHPHFQSGIFNSSLANRRVSYCFHGTSAHAAQAPHLGRSALDACELMNVGVNYLREHIPDDARVHYAYKNAGGQLPNIIPAEAELLYAIRAPKNQDADQLKKRVDKIAQGAALMTETTVDIKTLCVYQSLLSNKTLDSLVLKYLKQYTPIPYTQEEALFAQTFVPYGSLPDSPLPLLTEPDLSLSRKTGISTDVGNVSQILPCSAFMVSCYAAGSPLHSWMVTAQGKSSFAKKGMLAAAKILSSCALELFTDPLLLSRVQKDFLLAKSGPL